MTVNNDGERILRTMVGMGMLHVGGAVVEVRVMMMRNGDNDNNDDSIGGDDDYSNASDDDDSCDHSD